MVRLQVGANQRNAFPSLNAAIQHEIGSQPKEIIVAPGEYRVTSWRYWEPLTIKARDGLGTVIINCGDQMFLSCEMSVALDGLIIKGWGQDSLLKVPKGYLIMNNCELVASGTWAVEARGGSTVKIKNSHIVRGGILLLDCSGQVTDTTVEDTCEAGVSLCQAAKVVISKTVIAAARGSAIQAKEGSRVTVENCTLRGGHKQGPLVSVDDRAFMEMARTTVTGGNTNLCVDGSARVILDSVLLEDGAYAALDARAGSQIEARGTSVIRSTKFGILYWAGHRVPTIGVCFESISVGDYQCQSREELSSGHRRTFTWLDHIGDERTEVITYDSLGQEVDYELIGPPETREEQLEKAAEIERRIEPLLVELDSLVGLATAKKQIRFVINAVRVSPLRESMGLPPVDARVNLIFLGNPGTGKTTVARLYGQLLAALGVIETGKVLEVTRKDLVGEYLGHTTRKTADKIQEALGGVLFIDEAYALSRQFGVNSDFGLEAIDTLVPEMENNRHRLVVIVAGYTKEMEEFLESNSGLESRFGPKIIFEDYSLDEMVLILQGFVSKGGYAISPESLEAVRQRMGESYERLAAGNGREVRKLMDSMTMAQASRISLLVSGGAVPTREQVMELLPCDMDDWVTAE